MAELKTHVPKMFSRKIRGGGTQFHRFSRHGRCLFALLCTSHNIVILTLLYVSVDSFIYTRAFLWRLSPLFLCCEEFLDPPTVVGSSIPVTYVLGVDDPITCLSPIQRLRSCSGFVNRANLDRRGQYTHVHFSHDITRGQPDGRTRAVISRQRLSLRSSRQRARKLHGYRQREAAVRYKKNGFRTTTRPSDRPGTDDDRPGPRTTLTGENAEAAGSERR